MTQWHNYRRSLQKHFEIDALDNFLQWSTIQATMFVGETRYVEKEYRDIMLDGNEFLITDESFNRFKPCLTETNIGNPPKMWGWTSGNLIHQLYHLKQWLDRSQKTVSELTAICEIGAGYGALALICRRLGFTGQYYIIDLPELVKIQQYYLGRNGVMALWELPKSCDLFIGLHSLGEIPIAERERLLSQVAAKEYLFASSYEYEGVDNQKWFHQVAGMIGRDWVFWPHPYQENAFYQVGTEL